VRVTDGDDVVSTCGRDSGSSSTSDSCMHTTSYLDYYYYHHHHFDPTSTKRQLTAKGLMLKHRPNSIFLLYIRLLAD